MHRDGETDPKFDMMQKTNLLGQVGMIVCWYWGDEAGDEPDCEGDTMVQAVELVPSFLAGVYEDFSQGDWWLFLDALGSYPDRTPILEELYEIARAGHEGTLDLMNTKSFLSVEEDESDLEDEVMDSFDDDDDEELPPSLPFSPGLN